MDEDDVWKCSKHPSKRRRTGICPVCLRDKLASLCPDCAHSRPCACTATSNCSSSSYRFSKATTEEEEDTSGVRGFGGVSSREPSFRRSKSLVIPFLRSKPDRLSEKYDLAGNKSRTPSFWSMLIKSKSKRHESDDHQRGGERARIAAVEERARRMTKSKSVLVTSHSGNGEPKLSPTVKPKSWYFPSPMKVFKQTRELVFHERSPLHR